MSEERTPDAPGASAPQTWTLAHPERMEAALYLCPTPIGNLGDITLRTLWVLSQARVVLAEDTRRARVLLQSYALKPPELLSYHKFNEAGRCAEVVAHLRAGQSVALLSDAGTPLLADPGARLVGAVLAEGLLVIPLPGAQAVWPAVTASGLPALPVHVEGFLPRLKPARRRRLAALATLNDTLVFYEAPGRTVACLKDIEAVLGDRKACLAREITKRYETFWRGSVSELVGRIGAETVRGEVVLVVAGAEPTGESKEDLEQEVHALLAQGLSSRDIRAKLKEQGQSANEAYRAATRGRRDETTKEPR